MAEVTDWQKVSIAPMMDITDRRFRYFMRLINSKVRLYTEMIVAQAIVRGGQSGRMPPGASSQEGVREHRNRLLRFDPSEHPVILQLGGDDAASLAEAARIGVDFGYDGIDLNCGCPSDRVESGNFGVCLMRTPDQVAGIVAAIGSAVKVPVSVKCRIGITGEESEEGLHKFANMVFDAGAASLTVHARTATLGGLSPKENRQIPPLDYEMVYRLKEKFREEEIEINGGVKTREAIAGHLEKVDRVMIGRLAHEDPAFFSESGPMDTGMRFAILGRMAEYAERFEKPGYTAAKFFTNMLNIFHGVPGARLARRYFSEEGRHLSPGQAVLGCRDKLQALRQAEAN